VNLLPSPPDDNDVDVELPDQLNEYIQRYADTFALDYDRAVIEVLEAGARAMSLDNWGVRPVRWQG